MQPDRFTIRAQEALAESVRLAQAAANPQVTPAHLLSAPVSGTPTVSRLGDAANKAATTASTIAAITTVQESASTPMRW